MHAHTITPASSVSILPTGWKGPLLTGHRGAAAHARGNSLASFARAVAMGVDVIECDVRCTADEVLVLAHDGVVGTGGSAARIAALSYGQVRAREPDMLTLPQLLAYVRLWGVRLNVDLKGQGAVRGIVAAIAAAGWDTHTVVTTRAIHALRQLRVLAPGLRLGLSRGSNPAPGVTYWPETCALAANRALMPFALPAALRRVGANAAYLDHHVITPSLITALHTAGFGCYAWTVDDTDRAATLLIWGIDGITTNYPDRIRPLIPRVP